MLFRDAYKKVGLDLEAGKFTPNKNIHHTHEGSMGNLCNDRIQALMQSILDDFHFEKVDEAEKKLLSPSPVTE
jgi:argininosuccinate lyase